MENLHLDRTTSILFSFIFKIFLPSEHHTMLFFFYMIAIVLFASPWTLFPHVSLSYI